MGLVIGFCGAMLVLAALIALGRLMVTKQFWLAVVILVLLFLICGCVYSVVANLDGDEPMDNCAAGTTNCPSEPSSTSTPYPDG